MLASANAKNNLMNQILHIRFKLYSYVVWNPNQIAFLETHFSLGAQMRFGVAFLTPYKV